MKKLRQFGLIALLSGWGVIAFQPAVKALILDATSAVIKNCIVRDLSGLGAVVDTFIWGVRALFVLVVVGIIYVLWTKRDDNENLQGWMRTLGTLVVGAGLIGAFETFFLGNAANATASCSSSNAPAQQGAPPVPGRPVVPQ